LQREDTDKIEAADLEKCQKRISETVLQGASNEERIATENPGINENLFCRPLAVNTASPDTWFGSTTDCY